MRLTPANPRPAAEPKTHGQRSSAVRVIDTRLLNRSMREASVLPVPHAPLNPIEGMGYMAGYGLASTLVQRLLLPWTDQLVQVVVLVLLCSVLLRFLTTWVQTRYEAQAEDAGGQPRHRFWHVSSFAVATLHSVAFNMVWLLALEVFATWFAPLPQHMLVAYLALGVVAATVFAVLLLPSVGVAMLGVVAAGGATPSEGVGKKGKPPLA